MYARSQTLLSSDEEMKVCLYVNCVSWHHLPLPHRQHFVAIKIAVSEAPEQ